MSEFVEVKTADLVGAALDWAVAHSTKAWTWAHEWFPTMTLDPTFRGVSDNAPGGRVRLVPNNPMRQDSQEFSPSTDWSQGGPLIEKHQVCTGWAGDKPLAFTRNTKYSEGVTVAPTLLIAACRAIVASVLGETVSVPKELLS